MIRLEMKNCNIILTEKEQKYHHHHLEKIWIYKYEYLKYYKYEYLTGEEILPPDQRRVIEQAKFIYSRLGEAFEDINKNYWRAGGKANISY